MWYLFSLEAALGQNAMSFSSVAKALVAAFSSSLAMAVSRSARLLNEQSACEDRLPRFPAGSACKTGFDRPKPTSAVKRTIVTFILLKVVKLRCGDLKSMTPKLKYNYVIDRSRSW